MSGRLRDFLVELAISSELMTQFAADPAGVAERAGLAAKERDALLARDSNRLRRALGASAADHLTQLLAMRRRGIRRPKPPDAKKRATLTKRPTPKKRPGTKKR